MANQEETKLLLRNKLFEALKEIIIVDGKNPDKRILKKCGRIADSVIALSQDPSESNINLYKKELKNFPYSGHILGKTLKIIKEMFPGEQNQDIREIIDIPLMDAFKESKLAAAPRTEGNKPIPAPRANKLESMLRDRAILKQSGFSLKGNKQAGVSAGYIAQENKTGNTFILKHFYKSYKDCLTADKQKWDKQALSDRTDGVQELIGSSMYQFYCMIVPLKRN
ncbi:MAG: hypothetical protein LN563_06720 [Rickettsia endosymbiont of Platyusa sonomae]|nr:hypothetical protein [Rickettsia endosymbiont of Platyusa sonomae]